MNVRRFFIILLSLICIACSKEEEEPQQFSSYDLCMDGSRFIPDIGVPSTSVSFSLEDSNSMISLSTAPVPLSGGGKFTYAVARGNSLIIGNETTSQIAALLPNETSIIQLLNDSFMIYAVHLDGKIDAFDHAGHIEWQSISLEFPTLNSILAENALIFSTISSIGAIDKHSGKSLWSYPTALSIRSLIYDSKTKQIIAALSFNTTEAGDSILCFSLSGNCKSHSFLPLMRIISNLCLCGKGKDNIAFGCIQKPNSSDAIRTMHVVIFSGIQSGNPKRISDHEVSYLAMNVASNGPAVFSSGFQGTGSDLESGIDAFYADDTTKLWQRRFTYPLVAPVAISEKYAYFTLTFSTQAEVPAQSIFYTLDISTGKTLGELPVVGAKNGFAMGIPMPIEGKALMLSDRSRPVIYFLKP